MSCQSLSIEHNAVTKVPIGILSQAAELVSQSALLWSPDSVFDVFSVTLFFLQTCLILRDNQISTLPLGMSQKKYKLYCVLPLCIHTHIHVYTYMYMLYCVLQLYVHVLYMLQCVLQLNIYVHVQV